MVDAEAAEMAAMPTPEAQNKSTYTLNIGESQSSTTPRPASETGIGQPVGPLKTFMREQEVSFLHRVLAQTGGDKEKAAKLLDISLATLYRKLSEGDGEAG